MVLIMNKLRFVHLHLRTEYSIKDGLNNIESFVKRASSMNMPALAITDFTNFFGLIKFYNITHHYGVKPIVGADFLVKNSVLCDDLFELTILASNNIGYKNLTLLISESYKYGYDTRGPIIKRDWLINLNDGLILLSGGVNGDLGKYLLCNDFKRVKECLVFYKKYFYNNYYIELIRTGRFNEENYLRIAVKLASKYKIPIVATNDVRFIDSNDFEAHEVRVAIYNRYILNEKKTINCNYSSQQYMRNEIEMISLFSDLPEALINSVEIARRCNVTILNNGYFLPKFPTGTIPIEKYFINCAFKGLEERFINNIYMLKKRKIYEQRLNFELNVINKMNFSSYFLIVMEFIQWSKDNNILVGPGRGSGSGSLVAYVLKITDIDPIKFDLLFERFLNLERISMPDFDVDFCMEKRDLVIEHVSEKYGRDAVSQIITFGTMTAKAVIRDVGRVLGYSYNFVDKISKLIPRNIGITLKKSLTFKSQLYLLYNTDGDVKIIIDMACKLEGVIRNVSKHSGGVVISPTKIIDFSPLYYDSYGNYPVTQFDKDDIEYSGLVKFDFLGLRTLTIIDRTLNNINKKNIYQGIKLINISNIPLNDKKSFNMLNRLETMSVFQLESRGMKNLIKRLKPDCFEDIIALIALFRPGPLQSGMVDNFINRKHGKEVIYYPDIKWEHKLLKPILKSTYGVILYQEQVMQIAQVLANYTLSNADILRRAMSKKKPKEMVKQRLIFKNGSKSINIDTKLSMKIFDLVENFAGYGFNKSHSVAYALISYQTLWLKSNFPAEFMSSAMSSDMDNTKKLSLLIHECLRMNLKILPPSINNGQYYFYVDCYGNIVYGLGAIKGVGKIALESIIEARNKYGKFSKLIDLFMRVNIKKFNKRVLKQLILSGSLDCLNSDRLFLINSIDFFFKIVDQHIKSEISCQKDMFGFSFKELETNLIKFNKFKSFSLKYILDGEFETLGFYLTNHPINQYLSEIKYYTNNVRIKDINYFNNGKIISVLGLIESIRVIITKNGNRIGICVLSDYFFKLDVIIFKNVFKKYEFFLKKNIVFIVQGEIKYDSINNVNKIVAYKFMNIIEARVKYSKGLYIYLNDIMFNKKYIDKILLLLKFNILDFIIPIFFFIKKNNKYIRLFLNKIYNITPSDDLLNKLRIMLGCDNVILKFN